MAPPTTSVTDASSCSNADGQVEIFPSGGIPPYAYSLNGGPFQSNHVFTGLSAGNYPATVRDSRGCTIEVQAAIAAIGSTLNASALSSPDTNCFLPHTGSITVTATGGKAPYEARLNNGPFGSTTTFDALAAANYSVVIRDSDGCSLTLGVEVLRGETGTSYAADIKPILNSSCNFSSCHGSGNGPRNFTVYANVASKALLIKTRTSNLSMPPSGNTPLTPDQIQKIACWVDDGAKNN